MKVRAAIFISAGTFCAYLVRSWYTRHMSYGYGQGGPSPEPSAIDVSFADDIEGRRLFEWRLARLREAGFDELRAATLAVLNGGEWREAVELVRRGCDHRTATNIVL